MNEDRELPLRELREKDPASFAETIEYLTTRAKAQEDLAQFDATDEDLEKEVTVRTVNSVGLLDFISQVQKLIAWVQLLRREPRLILAGEDKMDGLIQDIRATIKTKLFYEGKEKLADLIQPEDV